MNDGLHGFLLFLNLSDAVPAKHYAFGPYKAVLYSENSGWAGVENANGFNCLTFKRKPGAVMTDYETAKAIADEWNKNSL